MMNSAIAGPCRPILNRLAFQLLVLPTAANEIEMIYSKMAGRSSHVARNWVRSFFESLVSLRSNPSMSGLAEESSQLPEDIFEMLFEFEHGYSIRALLLIRDMRVFVLHVGPCWMDG